MSPSPSWSPSLLLRALSLFARVLVGIFARLEVTGDIPREAHHTGLILAANHLSPFDPAAIAAACRRRGFAPRVLANAGLFKTPVIGSIMRAAGHIRVDRGEPTAGLAVDDSVAALAQGSTIQVYPEGRIGLDPGLWPERGRTGVGRLALATGAPVVPVALWGTHEVLNYAAPTGMWPVLWRALRVRPVIRVHFGSPVDLTEIDRTRPGAAQRATDRIVSAIIDELTPLRADEAEVPRFVDPARPVETRRSYRRA